MMNKAGQTYVKLIVAVFVFLIIGLVLYISFPFVYLAVFGTQYQVKGNSMMPVYKNGDFVQTQKIVILNRGDNVIYKDGQNEFIKRIVGLPGETIKISNGQVYINDQLLTESYLSEGTKTNAFGSFMSEDQPLLIPNDSYFLMGDNRAHSSDSRDRGFVSRSDILSVVK